MAKTKEYILTGKHYGIKDKKAHTYEKGDRITLTDAQAKNLVNKIVDPSATAGAASDEVEELRKQLAAKEAELEELRNGTNEEEEEEQEEEEEEEVE